MSPNASNTTRPLRIDAASAADARGLIAFPGGVSLLIRAGVAAESARSPWPARLLAMGPPAWVAALPQAANAQVIACPGSVLLPGLVNAHTHLDLTHIGPRPYDEPSGFGGWIGMIRSSRHAAPADIAASVRSGVHLLRRGGTVAVGDIAGPVGGRASLAAAHALRDSGMAGVSFIEFFALGAGESRGIAHARDEVASATESWRCPAGDRIQPLRIGLSPHATYSAGRAAYALAAEFASRGIPACSHVAECPEEHDLVVHQRGPIRDMLEHIGIWDDHAAAEFAGARSPVHVALRRLTAAHTPSAQVGRTSRPPGPAARGEDAPVGRTSCPPADAPVGRTSCPPMPFSFIHVNDCSDADLADLASARASVIYCPRASAYFHAESHFGPHRYRDMLASGLTVALGTDSIVNLPTGSNDPHTGRISVLDEMRFLHQRDGTDPRTLLAMATVNGAAVLGLDPAPFTFLPAQASDPSNSAPPTTPDLRNPFRGDRPLAGLLAIDSPSSPHAWLSTTAPPRVLI